ncbi:SDR family NAD(P)-dependent oxidoreductase [soil metagenome]
MATCVILGAGKGIGQSVAKQFKSRGYHIALCARNQEKLAELAQELGEDSSTWAVDVATAENLKQVLAEIASKHGEIEVLIYNAYSAEPGKGSTLDVEKFNQSLFVNASGALVAAQAVAPKMIANEKGTIIFTGGGFALQPFHNQTALSVGKAALRALAQCLHQELARKGVHAATVTVCGIVKEGTAFAPETIAKSFIELHDQPKDAFAAEITFTGK